MEQRPTYRADVALDITLGPSYPQGKIGMSSKLKYILLAFIPVATIGLWYGWYEYVAYVFPDATKISDEQAKILAARGQYGDLFGGVNSLFTALLLAGALYTVWLQQRQISEMKKQQEGQDRANQEMARLQAMNALVSARSVLVHTRYEMKRDFESAVRENSISDQDRPLWAAMNASNAVSMGEEFKKLHELAAALDQALNRKDEQIQE